MSSSIVGAVEAGQHDFEIGVTGNVDAQHLADDAAVEALDHAIGLGHIGFCLATTVLDLGASAFKIVGGEVGSPVGQDMDDAERECLPGGIEKGDSVGGILGVWIGVEAEPQLQSAQLSEKIWELGMLAGSPSAPIRTPPLDNFCCNTMVWMKFDEVPLRH